MKKQTWLTLLLSLILTLCACIVMGACGGSSGDDSSVSGDPVPQSITITNTTPILTPGTYEITATVLPAEADQSYTVSLEDSYEGISVEGKSLIVSEECAHEFTFKVKVTSAVAPAVTSSKSFTTDNPPVVPDVAITNSSLFADISSSNEFEIFYDVSPKNSEVVFSLEEEVEGIQLDTRTGIVTIDDMIDNKTTFVVNVTVVGNEELTDQKQFTVINEIYRPISTEKELRALWVDEETSSGNASNFYKLTNDIELTSNWYTYFSVGYNGTFDGQGYSITNFNFTNAGWNAGFFSKIEREGVVKNLAIIGGESGLVSAGGCCGVVAGYMFGTLENIFIDVKLTQTHASQWCGALYGASYDGADGSKVKNCLSVGEVIATSGKTGLIGSVNYPSSYVFTSSFALAGTVNFVVGETGAGNEEGVAQILSETALKTAATYEGWDEEVWFIANTIYPMLRYEGFVEPEIDEMPMVDITIENTEEELDYSVEEQRTLQLNVTTSPEAEVLYTLDGDTTGVTVSESGLISLSENCNNRAVITVIVTAAENEYCSASFSFTIKNDTVREINTLEDLMVLSGNKNVLYNNYILMADIELTENWRPIGVNVGAYNVDDGYKGTFDGNGYTISNLNMTKDSWNAGFFWCIASEGVVKNLALVGGETGVKTIAGGALAGTLWGRISDCYVEVRVESTHAAQPCGGIVGTVNTGYRLENCIYVGTTVSAHEEGAVNGTGMIATGSKNGIVNCYMLDSSADAVIGAAKVMDDTDIVTDCIKTEDELKTAETYEGWSSDIWTLTDGDYARLKKGCTR